MNEHDNLDFFLNDEIKLHDLTRLEKERRVLALEFTGAVSENDNATNIESGKVTPSSVKDMKRVLALARKVGLGYGLRDIETHRAHHVRRPATWPFVHGTANYDNFYLRTLLGEDAFLAPLGELNRAHLEKAKRVLDQFSVVIILERFKEQLVQLREAFQWDIDPAWRFHTRTTGRPKVSLAPSAMHLIRQQNALDCELYQYAETLAARLTKEAMAAAAGLPTGSTLRL